MLDAFGGIQDRLQHLQAMLANPHYIGGGNAMFDPMFARPGAFMND
jgi:hypothetical protein